MKGYQGEHAERKGGSVVTCSCVTVLWSVCGEWVEVGGGGGGQRNTSPPHSHLFSTPLVPNTYALQHQ